MARLLRGLTLRELSYASGLTPGALSQFEKGDIRPSPGTAARLSLALGLPLEFFALERRDIAGSSANGAHFRSLRSTSARERRSAWAWSEVVLDIAAALEVYVDLPPVDIPASHLEPDSGRSEIIRAAATVREAWNLPEGPVGNVVRQLEVHGVVAAWSRDTSARIDAFSSGQGKRPVVILGTTKGDAARSRFDAAHELGHLVCHPEADPSGGHEAQAHAFAAELLMPAELIAPELPRRFDLGEYGRLKHRWGVSIQALLYRARTLQVITEPAFRRAMVVMSQNYGRTREPFPLLDTERPQLLGKAYRMATANGATLDGLASLVGLPAAIVLEVLEDQPARPLVEL